MIRTLLQIEFLHGYFANGKFANFRVVPDRSTEKLLARYCVVSRLQGGVFSLYSEQIDEHFIAYLRDQSEAGLLTFFLLCDQQQFSFMTDLPLDWVGTLALSSDNVKAHSSGQFEMLPVLSSQGATGNEAVAVITVHLDDMLVLSPGALYVVDFNARSLAWHYYVINRSEIVLVCPAIVDDSGYAFEEAAPITLVSGERALSYSSGLRKLLLRQVPDMKFNLVDRLALQSEGRAIESCHIKCLPTPGLDHMIKDSMSLQVVCAMYVYL